MDGLRKKSSSSTSAVRSYQQLKDDKSNRTGMESSEYETELMTIIPESNKLLKDDTFESESTSVPSSPTLSSTNKRRTRKTQNNNNNTDDHVLNTSQALPGIPIIPSETKRIKVSHFIKLVGKPLLPPGKT